MEKNQKVLLTVRAFLQNPNCTIAELSQLPELKKLNISTSAIQRYLNDPIIINLFNKKTYDQIKEQLKTNTLNARRRAGITSFKNNNQTKDQIGRFTGSVRTEDKEKIERKIRHIVTFAEIFLNNPGISLQEIADLYNETNLYGEKVTKAYVYDCLASKSQYILLGEYIGDKLEQRRLQWGNETAIFAEERKK